MATAQKNFICHVKDSTDHDPLHSVTATVKEINRSIASDKNGRVLFKNLAEGNYSILFSSIGFQTRTIQISIPQNDTGLTIFLQREEGKTGEEVIVSSSRTNSRIEDLPTKVEIIGSEEVNEESGIMPGNITALLGDIAGIQNLRAKYIF